MRSAMLKLAQPPNGTLMDMTGMIKILGDRPMIDGMQIFALEINTSITVICTRSRTCRGVLARWDFKWKFGGR
jgi:hypothetical protein